MSQLLIKLDMMKNGSDHSNLNVVRSSQIGSGMRGDKRRTYRFQEDSVTDHVTGRRTACKKFMKGDVELLWA